MTDTVPEDLPDKPELDHGLDGIKSLPGFGSTPFLIFIPNMEEMIFKCKILNLAQISEMKLTQHPICGLTIKAKIARDDII